MDPYDQKTSTTNNTHDSSVTIQLHPTTITPDANPAKQDATIPADAWQNIYGPGTISEDSPSPAPVSQSDPSQWFNPSPVVTNTTPTTQQPPAVVQQPIAQSPYNNFQQQYTPLSTTIEPDSTAKLLGIISIAASFPILSMLGLGFGLAGIMKARETGQRSLLSVIGVVLSIIWTVVTIITFSIMLTQTMKALAPQDASRSETSQPEKTTQTEETNKPEATQPETEE